MGDSGHFSVVRLTRNWYIACSVKDLKARPLARTILDVPLVLFRDEKGQPAALLDRCAHRNVPLSLGSTGPAGRLVCAYHGWAFDRGGQCREVPALCGAFEGKGRRVSSFPVQASEGYIWVWLDAETAPSGPPFRFPEGDKEKKYGVIRYASAFQGTLHATLENILDVPHTAFLHRGLFRGKKRNHIQVKVRRADDWVEAEFLGEPRPQGVVGYLLAPKGGVIEHKDRFIMPSVAQVEYRLGEKNHIVVTSFLTPESDFRTKLYSVVLFRTALPSFLTRLVVTPLAKAILKQDQSILRLQAENIRRFKGEQFVSTEVDLLGPHIWRLLRQTEREDQPSGQVVESETELLA